MSSATHNHGHTLDLVMTRSDEPCVDNVSVHQETLSDHFPVHFQLPSGKPPPGKRVISYRKYSQINKESFQSDILQSALTTATSDSVDGLIAQYNKVLTELVNKHAPAKSHTITDRPRPAWYNSEIQVAKRERRIAERRWQSTGLHVHQDIYREKRLHVNTLIDGAKQQFFQEKITDSKGDAKSLFKTVNGLLHRDKPVVLPNHDSPTRLASKFADFFCQKIEKIHDGLLVSQNLVADSDTTDHDPPSIPVSHQLSFFAPATESEIRKLIQQSPAASCGLDPLPTWLLKENLEVLLPVLTELVNLSITTGIFPSEMKEAVITPLLKKATLDPELLKNFRPVSNLSFVSKLVERVVASRLNAHMQHEGLHETLQSAYRKSHSTETALVKITNDLLRTMDRKGCVLLVLLDMSAAFDTVDHEVLLARLHSRMGVSGVALSWFKSYLQGRTQCVTIQGSASPSHEVKFGVPQGSVLGPVLFSAYTSPLGDIMRRHNIDFHFYADDGQLYLEFRPVTAPAAVSKMEACIADVRCWLTCNFLQLNDSKTEFLLIGSKTQLAQTPINDITIGTTVVPVAASARNLGAVLDSSCSLQTHVKSVCRSAHYHLRNIGRIRKYLDTDTAKLVVHALVTSRLDQLNALLYGVPTHKLQRAQNTAARIITRTHKYDHITPVLRSLHWLPVRYRSQFKILCLAFKALNNLAPSYIRDMLSPYTPSRALRSSDPQLMQLVVPRTRTKLGDRAFSVAAPTMWNALPLSLRQAPTLATFQNRLKTHLFKLAFNV